jgi:hypothetical protein
MATTDKPKTNHAARKHTRVSPSKLTSLEICPRYLDDKNADPHPITLRGTAMHEALDAGDDSKLDAEEKHLVSMCRDFTAPLFAEEGATVLKEVSLKLPKGMKGTADLAVLNADGSGGWLIDYKFSLSLQEDAATNPAAQAYAFGLFTLYPALQSLKVAYLYPRLEVISEAEFSRADMPAIQLRMETIHARVMDPSTPPYPEVDNCLYCANKATCTALHALALPIATRYAEAHEELTIPEEFRPSQITDPAMMARAYEVALVLEKWCDSVKAHARELRFNTGAELPGFSLTSRSGTKKIVSPEAAYALALESGVTHEQFLTTVDVSLKKLSDAVAEKAARGEKGKAAQAFENRLRDEGVIEVGSETFYFRRDKKTKQLN